MGIITDFISAYGVEIRYEMPTSKKHLIPYISILNIVNRALKFSTNLKVKFKN